MQIDPMTEQQRIILAIVVLTVITLFCVILLKGAAL